MLSPSDFVLGFGFVFFFGFRFEPAVDVAVDVTFDGVIDGVIDGLASFFVFGCAPAAAAPAPNRPLAFALRSRTGSAGGGDCAAPNTQSSASFLRW